MKGWILVLLSLGAFSCVDDLKNKEDVENNGVATNTNNGQTSGPQSTGMQTTGAGVEGCGDGVLGPLEACDGDLIQTSCLTLGYKEGILKCSPLCELDLAGCVALETCNNGLLDTSEACEGFELRGKTCSSEGFDSGILTCSESCVLDSSNCVKCGDGKIGGDESCDTTQFAGKTCVSLNGAEYVGELVCDACQIDSSDCRIPVTCHDTFECYASCYGACDCKRPNINDPGYPAFDAILNCPACPANITMRQCYEMQCPMELLACDAS